MKSIRKPSINRSRYVRVLATAMAGLFMLGVSVAGGAAVRAQLERTTVQDGQTLTLIIESDGVQSSVHPDLAPLHKDFEVLGTTTSSETSIVNGTRSDRTRWLVQLQPLHTGTLDIPPITVGSQHTDPLVLNVTKPSPQAASQASKHVFLEVEAAGAGNSIYVQQQIPYIVRLYYDDSVRTGNLAAPDPADAIVEQLGKEQRYTAMRDGRNYNVIERHYAIAPEKSGALHIPPASFRGSEVVAQSGDGDGGQGDDPMARFLRNTPLGNDPFFKNSFGAGMFFGNATQPVVARGQEISLDVQPRPAGAQGNWLPAEQITMHDSWEDNPPQFKVGEPVTRTITINAKGLAASQIPPLSLAQTGNARLYPETPDNQSRTDGKTIFGISKQSVTYIPTAQGTLDVPPIDLPWWNTDTNAQSRAVLPAWEFKVEAGAVGGQAVASPPAPAATAPQVTSAATPSSDHPLHGASLTEPLLKHRTWLGSAAALLVAAILSVVAIRRSRRSRLKPGQGAAPTVPAPRRKAAMQALRHACVANDNHAAKKALLDLALSEWPDDPPLGLSALATRLEVGGKELTALDRSLYGGREAHWQGDALWRALGRGLQPKRGQTWHKDDGLGALYL